MSGLDDPTGPIVKSSSNKLIKGPLVFFIAGGLAVLGVALSIVSGERATTSLVMIFFFVFVAAFLGCGVVNNIARGKMEAHQAKVEEDERERREAQERYEQEKKEEDLQRVKEGLQVYLDFGFELRDITEPLTKLHQKDPNTGREIPLPVSLCNYILGEGTSEYESIRRLIPLVREEKATHSEIISLAFSEQLIDAIPGMTSEEFRNELHEALKDKLQDIAGGAGDLSSQFESFIRFEILLIPDVHSHILLAARKSRMRAEQDVRYQIVPVQDDWQDLDLEAKPFTFWEQLPSGGWRKTPSRYFYGGENSTITMGPAFSMGRRGEKFSSAIVDLWSDRLERGRCMRIDALANDEDLQRKLNIRVLFERSTYSVSDVYQLDQKGFVQVCGWFDGETFEPLDTSEITDDDCLSLLNVSAPNLMVHPQASVYTIESSEQNKLLTRFLGGLSAARKAVISTQGGNFEIRRGAVSHGSKIHKYFIKLAENAAITKFMKPAAGDPEGFKNFSSYSDFPEPREGFSPLEDQGYSSIPASDCYFRTGSESNQLVLKVNLGSPAPGETERGVSYSNAELRAALINFTRRAAFSDLEVLEEESAQGLVSRGNRALDGETSRYYAKLLDPTHSSYFASSVSAKKLIDARVIPSDVEIHRVDTYGNPRPGMIPIFVMPEYLSVEGYLRSGKIDESAKSYVASRVAEELAIFSRRTLSKGIVCTDFTLSDTFFPTFDAEAFLRESEETCAEPDTPRLFVGDFGSYIEKISFQRDESITREQYRPPEDFDRSLEFQPEPYLVYLLGLLYLEVFTLQPGISIEPVIQLRLGLTQEEYSRRVERILPELLAPHASEEIEKVISMLAYNPLDRPSLSEI